MNLVEQNQNGAYPFYTRNVGSFFCDKYTHEGTGVIVAGEGNFSPKFVTGKFGLHQRAYFITPKDSRFSASVLFEIIENNVDFLNAVAVGSTVRSLRRFCFESIPFYEDADFRLLSAELDSVFSYIVALQKESALLKREKSVLLRKYF
jgi:type I restriction enzyme S subunit